MPLQHKLCEVPVLRRDESNEIVVLNCVRPLHLTARNGRRKALLGELDKESLQVGFHAHADLSLRALGHESVNCVRVGLKLSQPVAHLLLVVRLDSELFFGLLGAKECLEADLGEEVALGYQPNPRILQLVVKHENVSQVCLQMAHQLLIGDVVRLIALGMRCSLIFLFKFHCVQGLSYHHLSQRASEVGSLVVPTVPKALLGLGQL